MTPLGVGDRASNGINPGHRKLAPRRGHAEPVGATCGRGGPAHESVPAQDRVEACSTPAEDEPAGLSTRARGEDDTPGAAGMVLHQRPRIDAADQPQDEHVTPGGEDEDHAEQSQR